MAKINNYKIDSMSESFSNSVNVTSHPVEKGIPLNDSVQRNPKTYSISGKLLNDSFKNKNSNEKRKKIEKLMESGKTVKYVGRINASDVLITSFSGTYSSNVSNGFEFSAEMQQIRIAKTPYKKKATKKKSSGKKTTKKPSRSTKKYHVVKAGDTYWGCAKKYGTTVAALRKLNPWPDRKIPIGVKMRIK